MTTAANPNGSVANSAGIINREGNIIGMMPRPERCVEELLGGGDGREMLASVVDWWQGGIVMEPKVYRQMGLTDYGMDGSKKSWVESPITLETGMFAVMWSERCGYKNSRPVLKLFPTRSPPGCSRDREKMPGWSILATARQ